MSGGRPSHEHETERLYLVAEVVSDGLWDWDITSNSVYFSPRMKALLGYADDELPNDVDAWLALIHPNDRQSVLATLEAFLESADGTYEVEHRVRHRDGSWRWVLARGAAVRGPDGRPLRMAGSHTDITERKRAVELLEQRVAERTQELATLIDVSRDIASTLDLRRLVQTICERTAAVTGATSVSVILVDGGVAEVVASLLLPETVGQRFSVEPDGPVWREMSHGDRLIVSDVRGAGAAAASYRATVGDRLDTLYRNVVSWLSVPLKTQERTIGVLSVSHHLRDYFTPHHADIVATIANQAAVAIENARLHEQALHLAALEERQRLARELHDSVSQALYGIALGARTARTQLDRDPPRAAEPLEYVLSLAEAGLAEMRALIFELRPESLEQEGLAAALEKQADALRARYRLQVTTDVPVEPDVPLPLKEALYRIAQEAMHNTVKHARAGRIDLRLTQVDSELTLEIRDDGRGFDTGSNFPGHLGMHSMRERAAKAGAAYSIESTPGVGTTVRVVAAVG